MRNRVEPILKAHGYELLRHKKHKVYGHEDGRRFVLPSTPSDRQWEQNSITHLARILCVPRQTLLRVQEISRVSQPQSDKPRIVSAVIEPIPEPLLVEPTIAPIVPAYSKNELKKLRRMEKHEQQWIQKRANQLKLIQRICGDLTDFMRHEGFTTYSMLDYLGFGLSLLNDAGFKADLAIVMVPSKIQDIYERYFPSVPSLGVVLDIITGKLRTNDWQEQDRSGECDGVIQYLSLSAAFKEGKIRE